MKKYRILSALLVFVLLIAFCSCEGGGGDTRIAREIDPAAVDHVWRAEYIPLPEGVSASGAMTVSGDEIYMNGFYRPDSDSREGSDVVLKFSMKDKTFSYDPLSVSENLPENAALVCSTHLPDGGSAYVYTVSDDSFAQEDCFLVVTDADGKTRFSVDAKALFDDAVSGAFFSVDTLIGDADGTLYLIHRSMVAAVSAEDGHSLWQYQTNGGFNGGGVTPDGRAYVTVSLPDKTETHFLDGETRGLGDLFPTTENFPSLRNGKLLLGGDYDFYCAIDDGLYGVNLADTEPHLLCDWLNSDIYYNGIDGDSITVLSEDRILCLCRDFVTHKRMLCVLTPTAPEDVTPKYLIHVGVTYSSNMQYLNNCVLSFNMQSDTFRAVVDDYSENYTPEDNLAAALVLGEKPDLLICGSGFDYEKFDRQGLFCDLYPFLDGADSAVKRDDFLPCIFTALENEAGEMHFLPDKIIVDTVYAKTDDVGGKTSWTLEEFLDAAEAVPEGTYFWSSDGKVAFAELLRYTLDTFIDRENAVCSFDSALFGRLLTFCQNLPKPERNEDQHERARRGELMLIPDTDHLGLGSLMAYIKTRYYSFGGAEVTPIGFPVPEGNGTVMQPETMFGITVNSPVADGAWEFLCMYMTGDSVPDSDFHRVSGQRFGFSATKSGLEALFESERNLYYAIQESGYHATAAQGRTDEEMRKLMNGQGVVCHYTEEDEKQITDMLNGITRILHRSDETILSMIAEDASYFFSGAKTLEETQKLIQGRVSIYISETMG